MPGLERPQKSDGKHSRWSGQGRFEVFRETLRSDRIGHQVGFALRTGKAFKISRDLARDRKQSGCGAEHARRGALGGCAVHEDAILSLFFNERSVDLE